jgi:hypothetical protein
MAGWQSATTEEGTDPPMRLNRRFLYWGILLVAIGDDPQR